MSENNTESSSIDQNSHIPRQMLSEIVYKQKMFHSKSKFSWFIITKSCKLYELKDKMILKSCKLKENCEVFETDLISIKTYFRKTKCIYLIQLNQQLLVLEDGNMFTLKNTFENVLDYQIKAINDTEKVVINLKNKSTPIITDCSISSVDVDTDNDANNSFIMKSVFVDVLNSMRNKITESKIELKTLQLFMKQFFNQNIREMRFGRNGAVTDFPDEKIPLVKYGDVWTKIHNDKLVIGIPLLNCTYGSTLLLRCLLKLTFTTEIDPPPTGIIAYPGYYSVMEAVELFC